jgi:uncharacterized membrane protein
MSSKIWLFGIVALIWTLTACALGSRRQFIFEYQTMATVTPPLEFFGAKSETMLAIVLVPIAILLIGRKVETQHQVATGLAPLVVACLPSGLNLARMVTDSLPAPGLWELIWFAFFTGLGLRFLTWDHPNSGYLSYGQSRCLVMAAALASAIWWFGQCQHYYQAFQLGFNDVGHFAQRVANTANGRGFLLETPVLPPFWDHFNPGLLFLVPVWMAIPRVDVFFAVQAIALALPAIQLFGIAKVLRRPPMEACLWGLAWLFHPAISQMNLAYTYGWHPITMAVPFLLWSVQLLLRRRLLLACLLAIIACSFEEGVIVIVGCFCAAMGLWRWYSPTGDDPIVSALPRRGWFLGFGLAVFSFVLVYLFSGLAEFQTARFATLGNSAFEVVLSPLKKPSVFFGLLFRPRNFLFLGLLFVPLIVAYRRPVLWYWLALALPLGVLLMWEHLPAQCIAFQYTSCLLPVFYVGAMLSQRSSKSEALAGTNTETDDVPSSFSTAVASVVAGWTLCLFVGQFPWTRATLDDVTNVTYGPGQELGRRIGEADNLWIQKRINDSRAQAKDIRVLSTGRLATHFVGYQDVETVGQYLERYPKLAKFDASVLPIERYDVIVLDTLELFQQGEEHITRVRDEAISQGFSVTEEAYGFQILKKQ